MIALILEEDGLDPTFIVGGIVDNLGTNARAGAGGCFVIEADEYDRTFLGLRPQIAVVTNIEHDHPDCYPDLGSMIDAFREFVTLMPSDGLVVGCGDEAPVRSILGKLAARSTTYGLGEGNDWHAVEVCRNDVGGNDFTALYRGERVGDFRLIIPGRHNVANALAAIAVAHELDIDPEQVASTLASFRGVGRRFETQGEIAGVIIIDDYAHHPTEIRATLAAARERFGTRPVWVVFQPHTYSRTKALLNKFAAAFGDADHVLVTNIFAAREHDDLGISSADLVQAMTHRDARYIGGLDQAAAYLAEHVRSGEVVITIGAGDVYLVGKRLMSALCGRVTSIGV
jgi:UDP-N-acetylmuramate--alanine ligase